MRPTLAVAKVHDVRFARYDGDRLPPWTSVFVLAWWSLLRAFGRRRGWSAKFVPFALLSFAFLPGLGVLTVRALVADVADELPIDLLPYAGYLAMIGTLIVLWTALITPELICPDLQYRVTSLYFATAVSPVKYILGKWLASMAALLAMTVLPVVVLFIGNVLFASSMTDTLRDDFHYLPRILASGFIVAVFYSTIGLAIAAQTGRRAYAIGAFAGLAFGSGILAGALSAAGYPGPGGAVNMVSVPIQLAQQLFHDQGFSVGWHVTGYVVMLSLAIIALWLRFFRRQA